MRATLRDPSYEEALDRHGFVVVPFLDEAQVAALREAHRRCGPAPDDPQIALHFGFHTMSIEHKRAVADAILPHVADAAEGLFLDHDVYLPMFITKWPGPDSGFPPHQDPTLVDERYYRGVTIWIPLVVTGLVDGRDNGMLHVLPGSHRFRDELRTRDVDDSIYAGLEPIAVGHGVGVPTRIGEGIVFDNRLIHYSMPNESTEPRLVVSLGMRPTEASCVMVRRNDEGMLDMYEIPDSSYFDVLPSALDLWVPDDPPVATVEPTGPSITEAEFAELCGSLDSVPGTVPGTRRSFGRDVDDLSPGAFCAFCGTTEDLESTDRRGQGKAQFRCRRCKEAVETSFRTAPGTGGRSKRTPSRWRVPGRRR